MSQKADKLAEILANLKAGRYTADQLRSLAIADVDGKTVKLSAPDAIAVVEARLAQHQDSEPRP